MFREHVPASLPWGASIPSFICEFIGLFNAEEKSELIIDGWAKNVVLTRSFLWKGVSVSSAYS